MENGPGPVGGMFYQEVVLAVLLYGSKALVLLPSSLRYLEGFHAMAAHWLTWHIPKKVKGE